MSGATVVASADAARMLRAGTSDEVPAAEPGRIVKDGDEVRLGNLLLTAIGTPAGLSWRWVSCDGGICRTIVYAGSLTPSASSGDAAGLARLAASPCEILVTAVPAASDMGKRLVLGEPLLDQNACKSYAAQASAPLDTQPAPQPPK